MSEHSLPLGLGCKWAAGYPEFTSRLNDVHVWFADLRQRLGEITDLESVLSEKEISRANRFHFMRDRNAFVLSRAILRKLLSKYLNLTPAEILLSTGSNNKPILSNTFQRRIHFNLSRSQDAAIFAFAEDREVGVDIEFIDSNSQDFVIAEQFFLEEETRYILGFSDHFRVEAFFRLWAGKEAYMKATGKGMSLPLNKFRLCMDSPDSKIPVRSFDESPQSSNWHVRTLTPAPNHAAAVAAQGRDWELHCWKLDGFNID